MTKAPFLGGYGVGRSTNVEDSQLMNLYYESTDSHDGKGAGAFYMCPGLTLFKTLGTGPVTCMHVMGSNLYVCSGNNLYQITPGGTVTNLGALSLPGVEMVDNGTQLAITNSVNMYLYGPVYPLSSITVDTIGSNYTAPTISFTGGGGTGGGTATATLTGSLVGVNIIYGGTGLVGAPILTLSGGGASVQGTAQAVVQGGVATNVNILSPGLGYSGLPTVALTYFTVAATVTATQSGGVINALSITNAGANLIGPPYISITGSTGGSGAAATATISNGQLSGVVLTSGGSGYSGTITVTLTYFQSAPTFSIVSSDISYSISAINVVLAGSYNSAPTVVITDTTGTSATATAVLGATTGKTLSTITLPFSFPFTLSYQDGFGLAGSILTNQIWQSDLLDLSTWEPLNFSAADSSPTPIQAIVEKQREQWIFKTDCIEIWVNAGLTGFSFQRLAGVYIEEGCASPYSVAKIGDRLIWLSQNDEGYGKVYVAESYHPERVSTHAIEYQIGQLSTIYDAIGYGYQQEGHEFYVLTFPTGNVTFVLDLTETLKVGFPMWHQRGSGTGGSFTRHRGNCHAFYNAQPQGGSALQLVGDYANGNVYYYDGTNPTDNGTAREWVRTFRAVAEPSLIPRRFDALQLDMTTGINTVGAPTVSLSWSDDGGHNFSSPLSTSAGSLGATTQRVRWNGLGSTTRTKGLDRIFMLTSILSSSNSYQVALSSVDILP